MTIRLETPADYREVENLTREAFWNVYRPGCTEHYVLNQYRKSPDFIPELDFVMEENDRLIGHLMFSKAELVLPDGMRKPSWTFGPICIHPDYKRKGYGLKLLQFALERAREVGSDSFAWKEISTFTRTPASRLPADLVSTITTSQRMIRFPSSWRRS